jgi:hypothetical protein
MYFCHLFHSEDEEESFIFDAWRKNYESWSQSFSEDSFPPVRVFGDIHCTKEYNDVEFVVADKRDESGNMLTGQVVRVWFKSADGLRSEV